MQLHPVTVRELIAKIPLENGLFVAGGQALNFWAEHYSSCEELSAYRPYMSKDMDFFGRFDAAERFAKAVGGKVLASDRNSPIQFVEAVVEAKINGQVVKVDFLNHVLGVESKDLVKFAVDLMLPVKSEDGSAELPLPIMHPLHVLQSRIANVLRLEPPVHSEAFSAASTRRRQANAAPIVLREYVSERLETGEVRGAQGTLRQLAFWLGSQEDGRRALEATVNDPLHVLMTFADDSRLDCRWRQHNLAPMITNLLSGREKRKRPEASLATALTIQSEGLNFRGS